MDKKFSEKYKNILSDTTLSLNSCGISIGHLTEGSVAVLKKLYTTQDLPKEYFFSQEVSSQITNPLVVWGLIKHNNTPDELLVRISKTVPRPFLIEILKKERIADEVIDAIVGDKTMRHYLIKYIDDEIKNGNRKIFGKGVSKRMAEKYCKELEYRPYAITRDMTLLHNAISDPHLDAEKVFPYILSNHYASVLWRDGLCQNGSYEYNLLDVLQPTSYMQNEIFKYIEEGWLVARESHLPEMGDVESDSIDKMFSLIEQKKMSEENLLSLLLDIYEIDIRKSRVAGYIEDMLDYLGRQPYSKKSLEFMLNHIAPKLHPMFFSKTYREHFNKIDTTLITERIETLAKEYTKPSREYDRGDIGAELKLLVANIDEISPELVDKLIRLNNQDIAMGILQNPKMSDSKKYDLLLTSVSNDPFICAFIHIFRNENLTHDEKMSVLQSVYHLKMDRYIDYLTGSEHTEYKAIVSLPKVDEKTIDRIRGQLRYINNVYVDDECMKKKIDAYIKGLDSAPELKQFEEKCGLKYDVDKNWFNIVDSNKILQMSKEELKTHLRWLEDNGYNIERDIKELCCDNDSIDGWCKFAIHLDKYVDVFDAFAEMINEKYGIKDTEHMNDKTLYENSKGEMFEK